MPDSRKLAVAGENTLISLARFSGLDRLDCLMILVAVLLGTNSHAISPMGPLGLDSGMGFAVPINGSGYWARRKITELIEVRRIRGAREQ